ncbi:MAG: F0F1 ATP synthase subunit B [Methylococcaceae bacterium]|nr:F0F1 ATP synthase subunit B [Methylococcaceae bacterium]MCI0733837.1 F0F1 ATP synthase subunit B [Methylococcaceae bacterium]
MSINLTLIGQMITFMLLVWFTMKYIWPPLMDSLEERKKKIAEGLSAAERGRHDMERAEKRATDLLKDAKNQAAEIVNLAQKRASEIVEESKHDAKTEGARLLAAAQADIEHQVQQVKDGLRQQVSELAISAAEQILQKEVDRKAHAEMIKSVAARLDKA